MSNFVKFNRLLVGTLYFDYMNIPLPKTIGITELRAKAAMWWPEELKTKNALANVLPLLLKSQDDFLRLIVLTHLF